MTRSWVDSVLPVTVCGSQGSPEVAELGFDDNRYGSCAGCGVAIVWRPHAPEGPKVCAQCALAEASHCEGVEVSSGTLEDVLRYIASLK